MLPSQIEQVSQLAALVQAQVGYHSRSAEILTQLSSKIDERSALPLPSCSVCWRYLEQLRSLRSLRCSKLQGEGNFRQTQERVYCQTSSVSGFLPQREPQRWNPRSSFSRWEPHQEACSLETPPETSPDLYLFFFVFTFCVIPKCPFQSLIEYEMLFFFIHLFMF